MSYCTVTELESRNPFMALTLTENDIAALILAAGAIVDGIYDRPIGYYADTANYPDGVPPLVKEATIYVAGYLFVMETNAGQGTGRIGDRTWSIEAPETIKQRLRLILYSLNQFSFGSNINA